MNKFFPINRILLILFLVIFEQGYASIGYPIITNFSSSDIGVTAQIWGITQDEKGILYFATNVGIVKFEGDSWELYETPLNASVRSISIDDNGTIYAGATREFGYLKTNESGKYHYKSISDSIEKQEFKSVLKTLIINNDVYFCANHEKIFKYSNDSVIEIDLNGISYYRAFKIHNEIYLTDPSFGVAKLINDKVVIKDDQPLPGTIYFLLPYGTNTMLAGTLRNGLYIYYKKQNRWEKLNTEIDENLKYGNAYHGALLRNGDYAISTLKQGLFIINNQGKLIYKLDKSSGLLSNAVYYLYEDKYSDLWVGQEKGISHIELSTPFTKFGAKSGLEGTLQNTVNYNNTLFCGTSAGIFYLPIGENGKWDQTGFKSLNQNYIYNLDYAKLTIPGYDKEILLASCLRDIVWITPDLKIEEIFKIYGCYSICPSHKIKGRIFLGSPSGIDIIDLKYKNGKIKVVNSTKWNVTNESIRKLLFADNGNLWVHTAFNSIMKIEFDENESLENHNLVTFEALNQSYPNLIISGLNYIDEKIILATNNGVFSTEINTLNQAFVPDFSFGLNFEKDSLAIQAIGKDKMGNYWLGLKNGLLKYDINKSELVNAKYRRLAGSKIQFINVLDIFGTIILTEDELYFINGQSNKNLDFNFSVVICETSFGNNYKTVYADGNDYKHIVNNELIPHAENSVSFIFCAPFYQKSDATKFSWKLEGFDKSWVKESNLKRATYTNLPSGEYTFCVKATNIYNNVSEITRFSFEIETPWYYKPMAIVGFALSAILFVWFIVILYTLRLKKEQKKLQEIIRVAVRKEEEQKEEIEAQAKKLMRANIELEQLSLVASKTDNAVVIMNSRGEVQWVNDGYRRMYGYVLEDLLNEGTKIIGDNANIPIKDMVNVWFGERKPILYENLKQTKNGKRVWVQTTLTPILNDKGQLIQLIAIDTDVTKLKVAEAEIEAQRDEIEAQRDMAIDQRDEIVLQKKEIIDSIKYANRIQNAILMNEEELSSIFNRIFVYNKPRDIVSGDFYWAFRINQFKIIACADCTGHGVPGAFMSLIGVTFLNNIVKENGTYNPARILDLLREKVIRTLGQTGKDNEAKDGMDISICVIDNESKKILFAGANNPSYLVRDDNIIEMEADKMPISIYHSVTANFTVKSFDYKAGEILYMFTDGYADQFGGKFGKKYKLRKFKELLINISEKSFFEQKSALDKEHQEWKGELKQVDDILVLGVLLD